MLELRNKDGKFVYIDVTSAVGNTDYVKDGVLYRNAPVRSVLVGSENDLELLEEYEPGTIAYTVGYAEIWQKSTSNTWESVV